MAMLDGVLHFVKTDDDRNEVSTWCEEQRELVLATLKTPQESDLPTLVSVVKSKGIVFFGETCVAEEFLDFILKPFPQHSVAILAWSALFRIPAGFR